MAELTSGDCIAKFEKNSREEFRVSVNEFHGRKLINIRVFYKDREDKYLPGKQHGWLVCGLHPADGGVYSAYSAAEYLAGYAGAPPVVHLRRGETLRRYPQPGLEDGKTFVFWGRNYNTGGVPGLERPHTWVNQPEKMRGSRGGAGKWSSSGAASSAIRRAVARDPVLALRLAEPLRRSLAATLEAASLPSDGLPGALRQNGLLAIHFAVSRVFDRDDSIDLSKTMAALDSRLKLAERCAQLLDKYTKSFPKREPAESPETPDI